MTMMKQVCKIAKIGEMYNIKNLIFWSFVGLAEVRALVHILWRPLVSL